MKRMGSFKKCLILSGIIAGISMHLGEAAFCEDYDQQRSQERRQGGGDFYAEVQKLVEQERGSSTTSQNVRERFTKLKQLIPLAMQSGVQARNVLSREEAETMESLLKSGGYDEAVRKVHNSIMNLEGLSSQTGTIQKKGMPDQGKDMQRDRRESSGKDGKIFSKETTVSSSSPLLTINVNSKANRISFNNILKLLNPAIDSEGRRLYVCGTKSTSMAVIDTDSDVLIDTFEIGNACGYLVFNKSDGNLYSTEIGGRNKVYKIDPTAKKVSETDSPPAEAMPPRKGAGKRGSTKSYKGLNYTDTGYPFEAGYLQDENASYGIIEITDRQGKQAGKVKHGPDALYFDIDQKVGKLYATNTGDASISVFDLNNDKRKIKDIDVGTSVDEIVLDEKTGDLYIRNRLGGSAIYRYDASSGVIATILNENIVGKDGIGMWPSKMLLDGDRLYVLSHYGARIDVIDTKTNKVTGRIPLNLSMKPRTDNISTMAVDRKRKVLYAAIPELAEIAVADAKNLKWLKTIKIDGYDKSKHGPNRISIAVDEEHNNVYVYLNEERIMNVYKGPDYLLEKKSTIGGLQADRITYFNNEKKVFYMGANVLDSDTMTVKGVFSRGSRVIGFDNPKDRVYLADFKALGQGKAIEKVYEYEGLTLKKEWTLSPILSIPSSFTFDFKNNRFYAGYFEAGVIEAFDLSTASQPSVQERPGQPAQNDTSRPRGEMRDKGGMGGQGGRCGDEICGPVERQNNVCPQDCEN